MRLDKFLKVSRLVKRRTVANELAGAGRVQINGNIAKAASQVKEGDILTISFGNRESRVIVKELADHVKKDQAGDMYEIL